MVALSPNFDIPFEDPTGPNPDQSGVTLHGGIPPAGVPEDTIAALKIDAILVAQAAQITALTAQVSALETSMAAVRWRHIESGTAGAGGFTVTVPAGYERLRMKLVGDLTGQGQVYIRINGDTGANYIRGFLAWDAAGAQDFAEYTATGTAVKLAEWSSVESNTTQVDIAPTSGTQNPNFLAYAGQVATGATTHRAEFGWGKYLGDVVVSSITIFADTTDFATVQWWLEGYLSP